MGAGLKLVLKAQFPEQVRQRFERGLKPRIADKGLSFEEHPFKFGHVHERGKNLVPGEL